MLISNQEQFWRLFCYLGFGVFIGIYLSFFHAWKRVSRPAKRYVFLHDCLFCTVLSGVLFLFSIAVEKGAIRMVSVLSVALGASCSYALLHRLTATVVMMIVGVFRRFERVTRQVASFFVKKLAFFCKKSYIFLKKVLRSLYIVVYNHKE